MSKTFMCIGVIYSLIMWEMIKLLVDENIDLCIITVLGLSDGILEEKSTRIMIYACYE